MVTHLENLYRLGVSGVNKLFLIKGSVPVLTKVRYRYITKPDRTRHNRLEKLCRISTGKRWTVIHTVRIWHPASLMCLLPWKRTCQDNVSPATKTSNLLPSRGWRNRQVHYMRLCFTNLSQSVTSVLNVKGAVLTNSILVTPSLCFTSGPL